MAEGGIPEGTEEIIKVFDRDEYAGPPSAHIQQMLKKLWILGSGVTVGRGDSYSANVVGTVHPGDDGGPVIRGKKAFPGECECHFHIKWHEVTHYEVKEEDVGYGPEAVIYLLGDNEKVIVRIFYPRKRLAEVETVLAAPAVPRPEYPAGGFFLLFKITFPSSEAIDAYAEFWHTTSEIIQRQTGSRGTRLIRLHGPEHAILAIPEWETSAARIAAYEKLNAEMQIDDMVGTRIAELGGTVDFVLEGDEIGTVFS